MHRRFDKMITLVLSLAVVFASCSGGSDPAEVGGERNAENTTKSEATSEPTAPISDNPAPATDNPETRVAPPVTGEPGSDGDERAAAISCTPIEDGVDTVHIGPQWDANMSYKIVVFEGSPAAERQFAVEVLDPGFSAATLRWEQEGAVFDGIEGNDDPLPVIEYYVSNEGRIDGLANSDEVRQQALTLNEDLAAELSQERAEAGRALIEAMSDEVLISLYATNESFFHSLDGTEVRVEPETVSTVLPPAGNFAFEVPSIATTEITERANSAGCVVVTQRIVPDPEALAELVSDMSVEGENLDPDQVETISESTSAWVDATTGEVRRLNRSQARNVGGESIVFATTDLLVLDAG